MCHTLPRIGYKSPYNRRVESRDSEEGEARQGGLTPVFKPKAGQCALIPTLEMRSSAPVVKSSGVSISTILFFTPLLK